MTEDQKQQAAQDCIPRKLTNGATHQIPHQSQILHQHQLPHWYQILHRLQVPNQVRIRSQIGLRNENRSSAKEQSEMKNMKRRPGSYPFEKSAAISAQNVETFYTE